MGIIAEMLGLMLGTVDSNFVDSTDGEILGMSIGCSWDGIDVGVKLTL